MPEYCVTGGTGLIAAYLVKSLLEHGHTVRATVRDPVEDCVSKKPFERKRDETPAYIRHLLEPDGRYINNYLSAENVVKIGYLLELKGAKDRLKLMKANLMEEGSFDEAIDGVDGVFHTASPVLFPQDDSNVQEILIDPAVKGTLNVLRSCKKSKSVKRVILTSSSSTIRYYYHLQVSHLNESHWSDTNYYKKHKFWYAYAKTLAEKAAWNAAKESGIDLVAVIPSFVVGPLLAPQPTSSIHLVLSYVTGAVEEYANTTIGFVHIDDVVAAHILAMEEKKAQGRLICASTVAHWSEVIQMLRSKYPFYPYVDKCSSWEGDNNPRGMDNSKILQLGLPPFKSLEQMFDDCIKSFQNKGFL